MPAQVDALRGHRGAGNGRFHRQVRFCHKCHHHPVVRGIGLDIDHPGPGGADRVTDRRDHVRTATLRKIRDALYEGRQTTPPATV